MIEARGIRKTFGELEVLKGVDFIGAESLITAIVGASGAGKSTLLNILGTLSRPDAGTLLVDGVDVFSLPDKKLSQFRNARIGFVFQSHSLLPEFTALENVMIPALIAGKGNSVSRREAERLLETVGLEGRLTHKPSELSGGECQRVAIARALINKPAVLLADEPTGNLDSATKEEIHKLFFSLRDELHQTMVIVTHDEVMASRCDIKLTMKDGMFL